MNTNRWRAIITLRALLVLIVGCAERGTLGQGAYIYSSAFNLGSTASDSGLVNQIRQVTDAVNDFKLCVRSIRFESEDDVLIETDGLDDIRFSPGLIDVSDGLEKKWTRLDLPTGFALKRIRIKLDDDKDLCGVDYSLSFNGVSTDEEVEFRWMFSPPMIVTEDSPGIQLPLDTIVEAFLVALSNQELDPDSLQYLVESVEEQAKERHSDEDSDDDSSDLEKDDAEN